MSEHQSTPETGSKIGIATVLLIAVVGLLFFLGLQIGRLIVR
jgi:hypothetical protein